MNEVDPIARQPQLSVETVEQSGHEHESGKGPPSRKREVGHHKDWQRQPPRPLLPPPQKDMRARSVA